jgi:hypothetical protein
MKETNPNVLQYYGVYCSNNAADLFERFSTNTPDDRKTISELQKCVEIDFLLSTSADEKWYKWKSIKQTQDGTVQPITNLIIKLTNQRSTLARNMISDIAMK